MMDEVNRMEVCREELSLSLLREPLSAVLSYKDGRIVFGPLVGRAHVIRQSEAVHDPNTSLVQGWKVAESEIETPLGALPGVRAELAGIPGLPLTLWWEWALAGRGDALVRLIITNTDPAPVKLGWIVPVAYRGAEPGLDMGAGYTSWRFFRTGYQSWSPAGSMPVTGEDYKPRFFIPSRAGTNPRTPYSRKQGDKVSDWMAQLYETEMGLSALVGFITGASHSGRVEYEVKYDRFRRLEAVSDSEDREVEKDESVSSEWALVSFSEDPLEQQARYYEMWGKAMQARSSPARTGWCSWYFSFTGVSERTMEKNLESASRLEAPLQVFQLDDGYERAVGDWTEWNEKWSYGPAELARRIRERGMEPGIWLAPFLVSRGSELYQSRPEWALRTKRGLPVVAFAHPKWKGFFIHALDATRPEVSSWLYETIRTVTREWGFTYIKLDFLYAAALPGERHDRQATGASALRQGLEVIREAAGDDTYLLGCGCPLGPAVGIMDAMRISPDIDVRWRNKQRDFVTGVPVGPGAGNCLRNNLARLPMQGRLWQNDPDCILMREGLTRAEIQSELTVAYASGGSAFLSENIPDMDEEMVEWFKRLLPPSGEPFTPVDLLQKSFPAKAVLKKDHSVLLAAWNWKKEARHIRVSLSELGLVGSWHAFDFFERRYLGVFADKIELGNVMPHGVRYLRLVRSAEVPRLLGTDLHMGMGEVGFRESEDQEGLRIEVNLPGRRQGSIWAVFPGGRTSRVEVSMENSWEGIIPFP
ncbi:MAG: alpha-galactosidase [bacterium]